MSYQLLLEGNLLQLHLVDASLGGANKRRGGNQGALHLGRRLEIDDVVWEMGWDRWDGGWMEDGLRPEERKDDEAAFVVAVAGIR